MAIEVMKQALEDYLSREMPTGTVIGDPKWWAAKIANVMTGKAVAEAYKQGYDHGVERQEAIQKLSEIEKQTPASKNQWWAKELEGFWGDSDYQVTLDTRRAAKTALTVIFGSAHNAKQEHGEPLTIPEYVRDAAIHLHENGCREPTFMVKAIVGWIINSTLNAQKAQQNQPDLDAICQDLQEKTYTQAMRIAELEEALAKQELLFEVDGEMLTLNQIAGVELFNFQEATGCDTAEEFKAKQEQGEPVGEMQLSAIYEGMVVPVVSVELPVGTKLYTTPQQRTWVGLTDEEINELWAKTGNIVGFGGLMFETIRAVEAKLKEKNT